MVRHTAEGCGGNGEGDKPYDVETMVLQRLDDAVTFTSTGRLHLRQSCMSAGRQNGGANHEVGRKAAGEVLEERTNMHGVPPMAMYERWCCVSAATGM